MNRKQLIFLLIALVVIGGAGLVLLNRNKDSWTQPEAKMGEKVLPNFQPNDVAAIHIKGRSDLNLVHKNDVWLVQERYDYPADFHQISSILIKLKGLKVVEADSVDPTELGRVTLDAPGKDTGGTLVEFKDGQGKVLDSMLLGKKHIRAQGESSHSSFLGSEPDGCYILLPKDPKEVLLISEPFSALQPNPQPWLSKDFFRVEKIKSASLTSTNAANSWKLMRDSESSSWTLAGAKPDEALDASKTRQISGALTMPRFTDVLPANTPIETGLASPLVVTIETFDHFTYTLKVGAKSPENNYYMTVAVTAGLPADDKSKPLREKLKQEQALAPWIYTIGSWIMDPLLRDRAQLLQGYTDENAASASKPAAKNPASLPGAPGWTPHVIQ